MELKLTNHSSYPRIGDDPEDQVLRRAIAQFEKHEKTDADLRAAEDLMTERALRDQIEAGLDLVTDAQVRWYDPVSHLAGKLAGVKINGLLRFFDTNFYFRQPVVHTAIRRTQPLVLDEFLFAQSKSARPVKPVLTGPLTLARLSISGNGKEGGLEGLFEGFTAAVSEEVEALAAAGATVIQVEEPALIKHAEDFPRVERSISTLAARKGRAQLAFAVYFGDPGPIYQSLQELPVDLLAVDFTYNPKLVDLIADRGSEKALALGLVDGRNTRLEDPTTVARQLERVFRKYSPDRAHLSPSCGLEYLPRERARSKLKLLAEIRRSFLGGVR